MASAPLSLRSAFISLLLLVSLCSAAPTTLRRTTLLEPDSDKDSTQDASPYRYFEVTKSIATPPTEPCSHLILHHQFGFTYGKPPVTANYAPPAHCGTQNFSTIVLEWTATSKGRQFDRIFGVWLGGVELLRSCTAEPRATGIIWTVKKDITKYRSLLMKNNTLAVYLGNLVTSTYTGVYDVYITIHFYNQNSEPNDHNSVPGFRSEADLILPISRNFPSNDGLWFEIENATSTETAQFRVPENVYRAMLEVYVSFHESDEFWYTNIPNDYLEANNLTNVPGNGPFREVVVALDGDIIGSVWPFTVIFTGGINPLFWRPITGISSFNLPSYDIEITPILARILDGKTHEFGFSVTNGLNVWYVDANLHLWIDPDRTNTKAGLLSHVATPLAVSLELGFKGFDGNFSVEANRSITSIGWVASSFGNITTRSVQNLGYINTMVMGNEGNMQIVNQLIQYDDKIDARTPDATSWSKLIDSRKKFNFHTYSNVLELGNGTESFVADVLFGFNERFTRNVAGFGISSGEVWNTQTCNGTMVVKDNLVSSGIGSTKQVYSYNGSDLCYFRNISSTNYTILYDKVVDECGSGGRR